LIYPDNMYNLVHCLDWLQETHRALK